MLERCCCRCSILAFVPAQVAIEKHSIPRGLGMTCLNYLVPADSASRSCSRRLRFSSSRARTLPISTGAHTRQQSSQAKLASSGWCVDLPAGGSRCCLPLADRFRHRIALSLCSMRREEALEMFPQAGRIYQPGTRSVRPGTGRRLMPSSPAQNSFDRGHAELPDPRTCQTAHLCCHPPGPTEAPGQEAMRPAPPCCNVAAQPPARPWPRPGWTLRVNCLVRSTRRRGTATAPCHATLCCSAPRRGIRRIAAMA